MASTTSASAGLVNDNHVSSPSSSSTTQKNNTANDDNNVDISGAAGDEIMDEELMSATGTDTAAAGNKSHSGGEDDADLEEIKARVREMEEEAEKLKQMQDDITSQISNTGSNDHSTLSPEERAEIDSRSIYVGNVDYSATADDLEKHFHGCGSINRVTILCDKYTGHPKGFAYIEFADKDSVETATALDDSLFKGRQIKVNAKRTNRPGLSSTNRPPRGRGLMARGGRGGFGAGGGGFIAGGGGFGVGGGGPRFSPWYRGGGGGGRARGFRPRGWYSYSPY